MVSLRKAAGLSQVELAERMGVGQSYISKIERGEAYVDVLVFVDWCKACGVKAGQTLDRIIVTPNT
jgi:transcriptional regulator with XRE-family HTH domain